MDFLLQGTGDVIPVEAKASVNLQAKSLKFYCEKFRPPVAVRTSLIKYFSQKISHAENGGEYALIDLPLYGISRLKVEIDEHASI